MSQEPHPLEDFGGTARLFPLPNLVLFPHVAQPLHIFEARYRQMMADALEDDRRLAMALLRPGWEEDYHLRPPIHPVVCLGRVHDDRRLVEVPVPVASAPAQSVAWLSQYSVIQTSLPLLAVRSRGAVHSLALLTGRPPPWRSPDRPATPRQGGG